MRRPIRRRPRNGHSGRRTPRRRRTSTSTDAATSRTRSTHTRELEIIPTLVLTICAHTRRNDNSRRRRRDPGVLPRAGHRAGHPRVGLSPRVAVTMGECAFRLVPASGGAGLGGGGQGYRYLISPRRPNAHLLLPRRRYRNLQVALETHLPFAQFALHGQTGSLLLPRGGHGVYAGV